MKRTTFRKCFDICFEKSATLAIIDASSSVLLRMFTLFVRLLWLVNYITGHSSFSWYIFYCFWFTSLVSPQHFATVYQKFQWFIWIIREIFFTALIQFSASYKYYIKFCSYIEQIRFYCWAKMVLKRRYSFFAIFLLNLCFELCIR